MTLTFHHAPYLMTLHKSDTHQFSSSRHPTQNVMASFSCSWILFIRTSIYTLHSSERVSAYRGIKYTSFLIKSLNQMKCPPPHVCLIHCFNERKSEQAHIPHAPTLLENAVYNEWQFQALVTGNQTKKKGI